MGQHIVFWFLSHTLKTAYNGHSKEDKTQILMTNGSLMKVERIAEYAPIGAFCKTFDIHKAIIGLESNFWSFWEWSFLYRFTVFANIQLWHSLAFRYVVNRHPHYEGAQWLSGRALDSRPRGRGLEPHRRHCVVFLSKNINSCLVLVQPRKTRPYITERLLMGRKESNQTKPLLWTIPSLPKFWHGRLSMPYLVLYSDEVRCAMIGAAAWDCQQFEKCRLWQTSAAFF